MLIQFDQDIIAKSSFTLNMGKNTKKREIEFQFPPKIVNESNAGLWFEVDIWGIEPLRIHKGSAGRKVEVMWEYIAGADTTVDIWDQLKHLKTYFFNFQVGIMPIAEVCFPDMIGDGEYLDKPVPFRLHDVAITHGPEIVSLPGYTGPLYTKVVVTMSLATNVSSGIQTGFGTAGQIINAKAKMIAKNLQAPPIEWW